MPRPLTPDETQVINLAGQGLTAHDIAHQLGVERRHVDNAIARIRRALDATDLHHAVQIHRAQEQQ